MKVDLAEIYRRKTGQNLSVYSSPAGVENVWKYFRKFYRSRGRIGCNEISMKNAVREFEWRHNNMNDIFNGALLQPEITHLLAHLNATRVPAEVRLKKQGSAKKSAAKKKVEKAAKAFVAKYLPQIKSLIRSIKRTILP